MIDCKKCGAEIPDGSNFCSKCGTPAESKPVTTDGGDKRYWMGGVGIILLISGILTLGSIDYDFTSIGTALGLVVGTLLKFTLPVAIPVGGVALVIWLIKRKKK